MLYSEFVENTGCKENDHNYTLYKRLELIYMNDDTVSKQDIYDMGKKLMDNSKSEAEVLFEEEMHAEIASYKDEISNYQRQIENEKSLFNPSKPYMKYCREQIRFFKRRINECKWLLGEK